MYLMKHIEGGAALKTKKAGNGFPVASFFAPPWRESFNASSPNA